MDRFCPQAAKREHSGIFTLIMMLRRIIHDSKRAFMLAVGLGLLALALSFYVYPCFRQAAFTLEGEQPKKKEWPFYTPDSETNSVRWAVPLDLSLIHPRDLIVVGNGLVHSVLVNGHQIPMEFPQALDGQNPWRIKLGEYLRGGENLLTFQIEKGKGASVFRIFLDPADLLNLLLVVTVLSAIGLALWGFHLKNPNLVPIEIAAILFLGIAIRVVYVSGTPYSVRSHDTGGHVDYIKYVADKGALPAPMLGWETHQPPLYYFGCAMLMRWWGMESTSVLYGRWQFLSLLMSVGGFLLCFPISRLLFSSQRSSLPQCLFLTILATYPGLVFVSSRLSNDAAYTFLSFLWLFLLLKSWRDPSLKQWISVFFCLGLGILTKNTTLALVATTVGCLAIHPGMSIRSKAGCLVVLLVVLALLAGWYQVPRALCSPDATSFIIANHDPAAGLRLFRSVSTMLTFNPIEVVRIPFNDPWADSARRMFFSEYFFKSSLFGEWNMGDYLLFLARVLAACGIALVSLAAIGFGLDLRHRSTFFYPLLLTTGSLLGSCILFFWKCPFACNQDFRYQVLLVVPLAYWQARVAGEWKMPAAILTTLFAVHSVLLLCLLVYL